MHRHRPQAYLALLALFALLASASLVSAEAQAEKRLLNVSSKGLAIKGYDPVAYFTQNAAVKGDKEITAEHEGATYRFASVENRDLFTADPAKYAPAYGGYCAYGASIGKLFKIDPEAFAITEDGRLILQYDKDVAKKFDEDFDANLAKADANWPTLLEEHGE